MDARRCCLGALIIPFSVGAYWGSRGMGTPAGFPRPKVGMHGSVGKQACDCSILQLSWNLVYLFCLAISPVLVLSNDPDPPLESRCNGLSVQRHKVSPVWSRKAIPTPGGYYTVLLSQSKESGHEEGKGTRRKRRESQSRPARTE